MTVATLTIRGLAEEVHARLRVRAARNGRSMEAEVRAILEERLVPIQSGIGLGSRIHARFAALDDAELTPPPRRDPPRAPDLGL